jgi:hypothetical protein
MDRKDAGEGRGHGMFAQELVKKGENVVKCRPALSVVFDPFATKVCGFCFKCVLFLPSVSLSLLLILAPRF